MLAADVPDRASLVAAVDPVAEEIGVLKIGLELFVGEGPSIVTAARERWPSLEIFLDLKLHDIPNTMRGAVRRAKTLGAHYLTVHAAPGLEHLQACVEEAGDALKILAVTVLTSQDAQSCVESGHIDALEEIVAMRTRLAARSGAAGIVCSTQEVERAATLAPSLLRVVPGIRPAGADVGDQRRVGTPASALRSGATHLVVGRAILGAPDPKAAARQIAQEMADALAELAS